jgi:hypothetical protein
MDCFAGEAATAAFVTVAKRFSAMAGAWRANNRHANSVAWRMNAQATLYEARRRGLYHPGKIAHHTRQRAAIEIAPTEPSADLPPAWMQESAPGHAGGPPADTPRDFNHSTDFVKNST